MKLTICLPALLCAAILTLSACDAPAAPQDAVQSNLPPVSAPANQAAQPLPGSVTIEAAGAYRWRVSAQRTHAGVSAAGEALLSLAYAPGIDETPHAGYAGARAWLAVARTLNDTGKFVEARAATRFGIDELGPDYADPAVIDDTDAKLVAADDQAAQNKLESAALAYISILDNRLSLYNELYKDVLLETTSP
jgi:hypothetical protein